MSQRSYTKGANRSFSSAPRYEAEDRAADATVATTLYSGRKVWHRVYKDGVQLSYSSNLASAQRHAERCGGKVVSSKGRG